MNTPTRYSSQLSERAVGMVLEHEPVYPSQWAVVTIRRANTFMVSEGAA
jgi:hypothetical protein